jgi:hypothetical protein
MILHNKILFISPNYFDYPSIISSHLQKMGYSVHWFNDRPNNRLFSKALIRINPHLCDISIKRYFYHKIIPTAKKEQFDYVFVILGQSFTPKMIDDLRKVIPSAFFVLYLWDSVRNFPQFLPLSKSFDKTYSFERKDSDKYDFQFLPLFFIKSQCLTHSQESLNIDCSFIGTIKKGKYAPISPLISELNKHFHNNYFYLYMQSQWVYFFYKIFQRKEFRFSKAKDFKFKPLDYSLVDKIACSSRFEVDIPMEGQSGLTIRVFEALANGIKLITTNKDIISYDFYNPKNILIFDCKPIDFNTPFFTAPFEAISPDVLSKYEIDNWLLTILSKENQK